jgi:hypothetical protein
VDGGWEAWRAETGEHTSDGVGQRLTVKELDVVEVLYEATGKLGGTRPEELLGFERGLHPTAGSLNQSK